MFDISKLPNHKRSHEAHLLHEIREHAYLTVTVPEELKKKLEEALAYYFENSSEVVDSKGRFYRTRIHEFDQVTSYKLDEMGAPPKECASLGRIQLARNSVLYTSAEIETAIAEVRPSVGCNLTIATFSPKKRRENKSFEFHTL
jgi:hypothetical protein